MRSLTTASVLIGCGVSFASAVMGCATADPVLDQRSNDEEGGASATSGGMATSGGGSVNTAQGGAPGSGGSGNGGSPGSGGSTSAGGATGSGGSAKGGSTGSGGSTVSSMGGAKSSGSSGTQLFLDDFEDGDYTAPPDQNWIPADTYGTWSVATQDSSKALTVVGSSKATAVSGNIAWTDQLVTAKVKIVAGSSAVAYLLGRWAATKSYVVLEYRAGTASSPEGDLKLRENDNGSTTDLCRYKPPSALASEWHTIGFSVKGGAGGTLTIYFDGQPVTADKPCVLGAEGPTAGGIAVGVSSGTAAFDDVKVVVP
ncbi:MAG: hypothetical protein ACOY0T_29865 [Myxococcota bacterium]